MFDDILSICKNEGMFEITDKYIMFGYDRTYGCIDFKTKTFSIHDEICSDNTSLENTYNFHIQHKNDIAYVKIMKDYFMKII